MVLHDKAGEAVGGIIPSVDFAGFFGVVTWLIILLVVIAAFAIGGWWIIRRLQFNNKIVIWEKIAGTVVPGKKDIAKEIPLKNGMGSVFYLKKNKKYIPRPEIQTGKRTFFLYKREDGELINFQMPDIDEEMKEAGVTYIDKDMRLAMSELNNYVETAYKDKKPWKEYAPLIVGVGFIVLIGIMTWLLFDKWIELAATTNAGVETAREVMETAKRILTAVENVKTGGSGIEPAGIWFGLKNFIGK